MNKKIILGIVTLVAIIMIGYIFYSSGCSADAQTVINKYKINMHPIEGCQSKSFKLDGKSLSFIHITYGQPMDCSSGCIYSHYCSIVEDGKDYPYAFDVDPVNGIGGNILILNATSSDSRYADKSILSGKNHRLASSSEFIEFLNKETLQNGEFRWCKK
jgi:hypothetical protein